MEEFEESRGWEDEAEAAVEAGDAAGDAVAGVVGG